MEKKNMALQKLCSPNGDHTPQRMIEIEICPWGQR